jgi:REP element-mobilizing transposase RayT
MVAKVWSGLGLHYPVGVDAFVVMPNHVHGILVLGQHGNADRDGAAVPTPALSLSTVVQRFKTFTMHEYGRGVTSQGWPRYPGRLWQQRFHDHIVRDERDLAAIREYIANNPLRWRLDRENPERLG